MNMNLPPTPKFRLTGETILYLLAFLLAFSLRFFRLGASPLTDFEANWALQAWDLVQGKVPNMGPQPAYVILTAGLFYLFSGLNALARLLPALAGSLLVLLPLLLKRFSVGSLRLKRAGLLLAFFLALDPALVSLSRVAGSPMVAISFSLLTLGLVIDCKPKLAGILGALALLSGPTLLEGLLGLGLAWLAVRLFDNSGWLNPPDEDASELISSSFAWKQMAILAAGTILVVGTGFLLVPQGLGAFGSSLPAYLKGWITPTGVPALRILVAPLLYQPVAVLFGLVGAFSAWFHFASRSVEDYAGRLLSIWALLALFSAIIYPGHQVSTAAWALIPLWGLASLTLAGLFPKHEESFSLGAALGQAGLIAFFLVLIGHNLLRLDNLNASFILYLAVVGGISLMGLIVTVLVAAGWSGKTALWGVSWGVAVVLQLVMLSFTWKSAILNPNSANELWSIGPSAGQLNELVNTVTDLSWWNKGQPQELDLVITSAAPSLRWAFRFFENATFKPMVSPSETPSVIISSGSQQSLSLSASYRGEDLVLSQIPSWAGPLPADLLRWLVFRQAPSTSETVILWAKNDIFPGGSPDQAGLGTP